MREFKTLTTKTKKILNSPEGFDVDFKETPTAVKHKDIVAFANSPNGGTILVGVKEFTNVAGVQRGKIIGCTVDDNAILQIRNKATDCIPPVEVKIYTENLSKNPILRVEIPYSNKVPHCTKNGEYSIRSERRTRGLFPEELLAIFLSKESEQFLGKFRNAIQETEEKIDTLKSELANSTSEILNIVGNLEREIDTTLQDIFSNAEEANMNADEANFTINEIHKLIVNDDPQISSLSSEIFFLQRSLDSIIHYLCIPDPNIESKIREIDSVCLLAARAGRLIDDEFKKQIKIRFPFVDDALIDEKIKNATNSVKFSDKNRRKQKY